MQQVRLITNDLCWLRPAVLSFAMYPKHDLLERYTRSRPKKRSRRIATDRSFISVVKFLKELPQVIVVASGPNRHAQMPFAYKNE